MANTIADFFGSLDPSSLMESGKIIALKAAQIPAKMWAKLTPPVQIAIGIIILLLGVFIFFYIITHRDEYLTVEY